MNRGVNTYVHVCVIYVHAWFRVTVKDKFGNMCTCVKYAFSQVISMYVCECMCICVHVCVYVCMLCMYMYVYLCVHVCLWSHTYIHTYMHTYIHTHKIMFINQNYKILLMFYLRPKSKYMHTHTQTQTYIHTYIHTGMGRCF